MLTLSDDITKISRVGMATAKKLKKLEINTVHDLLFYYPYRYDDYSKIIKIKDLRAGMSANVVGNIELIQNRRSHRKRMNITEALVNDGSDTLKVIWFNQPFIANNLKAGDRVSLAGKVEDDYSPAMISPVYEKLFAADRRGLNADLRERAVHTQGLVPNYHLTANITQKQIRFLIKQIINLTAQITDWLPEDIKRDAKLINLGEAIKIIHFPKNNLDIKRARERLAFNELFLIQLQSQLIKKQLESNIAELIKFYEKETVKFVNSLPFKLTNAQRKSAWEIIKDIGKGKPMARLLEGDVGSGKTLVACIAMLNAALNKKQSVLMAPTEILAKQHYKTTSRLLNGFNIKIGIITGSEKNIFNFQFSPRLRSGQAISNFQKNLKIKNSKLKISAQDVIDNADIIIGTHALIQEKIKFKNLGIAIIDEQHRFGVEQRQRLMRISQSKSASVRVSPHLLSMTATPIPRSLALALYGDLDISIINEMPKNRKKIITKIVPENKRVLAYAFIKDQIKSGRQVFVICPLIDISDRLGVKSVKQEFEKLDKNIFPEIKIAMLHGRMKAAEKENTMQDFLDNKIKILVSTSVVEVGVDVPNAAVMMIEGADRFGLAQIHQFRGRVGRSEHQSYCFLFTDSDLPKTKQRLQAVVDHHDGFELAKMDLKYRGPGEFYGTAQKGFPELKIATLFDYQLMKQSRDQAIKLVEKDKTLNSWPALKFELGEWEKNVHME